MMMMTKRRRRGGCVWRRVRGTCFMKKMKEEREVTHLDLHSLQSADEGKKWETVWWWWSSWLLPVFLFPSFLRQQNEVRLKEEKGDEDEEWFQEWLDGQRQTQHVILRVVSLSLSLSLPLSLPFSLSSSTKIIEGGNVLQFWTTILIPFLTPEREDDDHDDDNFIEWCPVICIGIIFSHSLFPSFYFLLLYREYHKIP